MPDVRYICLSDMHLGDEDCLLTNLQTASSDPDPLKPSPVMAQLVDCIRFLIQQNEDRTKKPTLILNGDIFEMALATDNMAAMVFERFVELIMPPGGELFEKIVYVPGNHDHHLWESARETQYVNFISSEKNPPGTLLPIPWHTTNIFVESDPNPIPLYFPTRIVQRYPHLRKFVITAAYPNFGLLKQDSKRCVIFSHGDFIESLYLLMSHITSMIFPEQKFPELIWNVEAQNFAWIDFFWSTMGRSGDAGKDIEIIYEKMRDKEQFKKLLYNLADGLAKKYDLPGWGDKMEAEILKVVFGLIVDGAMGTERTQTDRLLSPDAEKGLWWYMNGPLRKQINTECEENKLTVPTDVTFVFGHTHKPFAEDLNFKEYPGWVNVYNAGGWVVESDTPQPLHGGSIVLVDENLETVSVRMYNESADPAGYAVRVEEATHGAEDHNPFFKRIRELVIPGANPWMSFSNTVARAVRVREQNLRASINEKP